MNHKRKTIGFLVDWTDSTYHLELINGVKDCAEKYDANLYCFKGGTLSSSWEHDSIKNTIYDIVGTENVDGLVILSGTLAQYVIKEDFYTFVKKFKSMPVVSLNMNLPGIPSIIIENKTGMKELVYHLVKFHSRKRPVFISGTHNNSDSLERLEAFKNAMGDLGLEFNENMVFHGNFTGESGRQAAITLLNNKKINFDCVIAANDAMAFGAMNVLKEKGFQIPMDIAITGFDDLDFCRCTNPLLTTVHQPLYEQGWKAAEILLESLNGKEVPQEVCLKTKVVLRESCGCFLKYGKIRKPVVSHLHVSSITDITGKEECVLRKVLLRNMEEIYPKITIPAEETDEFIHQCILEINKNKTTNYLLLWDNLLNYFFISEQGTFYAFEFISLFRNLLLSYVQKHDTLIKVDELFYAVIMRISTRSHQIETHKAIQTRENRYRFTLLRDRLLVTPDLSSTLSVLTEHLPHIGIKCFYLTLFEKEKTGEKDRARLILAFDENNKIPLEDGGTLFDSRKLVPESLLPREKRYTMIVEVLIHKHEKLGYIVLEANSSEHILMLSELQRLISITLQNALLFQQVEIQRNKVTMQKERLSSHLIKLRKTMGGIIETMALSVELRDPYTAGHQRQVSDLARAIATEMKLPSDTVEAIRMAGIIHDLGKLYVPAEILNRPGKLDEHEFGIIKKHPQLAYDILKNIDFPWPIAKIILQHHERLDGSGYPQGLKGNEITMEAKVLSVADVVEAMASFRPYRKALGTNKALEEIQQNSGILYEKDVVNACVKLFIKKKYTLQ